MTYLWSEAIVTHLGSSRFGISAIPGTRSQALNIESPEVAKLDVPLELAVVMEGTIA
jgi:hypothetical protein